MADGVNHGQWKAQGIDDDWDFEFVQGLNALFDRTGDENFAMVFEQRGAIEIEREKGFGEIACLRELS